MARLSRLFLALTGITILGLVASAPLWLTPGLPNSDDSLTHIFRLFSFDQQVRTGDWYPLRLPDHGLAYGYAVLAYYPPLPYFLLEAIHLTGAGFVLSYKLGFTLIAILAGWTSFALGRTLFGARAGWLAASAYLFNPYFLANLHLRGALAEHLGVALGPLVFLALFRLTRAPGWATLLAASLTVALLICAHFLSTLLYLPFALLYGLWLLASDGRGARLRRLGWLAGAALTGAALAAFYWLPAALEPDGRNRVDGAAALAAYLKELFPLIDLMRPAPVITYSNIHGMPELGLPLLILIGLALVASLLSWHSSQPSEWAHRRFWGVAALIALFLSSSVATPFWQAIPAVALIQFPFRWLGPAALFLALFIGTMAVNSGASRAISWLLFGLLVWYAAASLWNLPREPAMLRSLGIPAVGEADISQAGLRAYEYDQADNLRKDCWVWAYEYVPRTSSLSDCAAMRDLILDGSPLAANLPPTQTQIQPTIFTPSRLVAQVDSAAPWTLSLHAFWIPGWRATVDGESVVVGPVSEIGMAGVTIPAGQHTVQIEHGPTPLRRWLRWFSLVVFGGWLLLALRHHPRMAGAVAIGLLLLIGPLWWTAARAAPPPSIQATAVEFAGEIALQGFGLATHEQQLRLDLVWLARQETDASYKVFVHLIDDSGKLWAQDDSRPLRYASNTNRWLPGQLILDQHELNLPAEMPPGSYQVRVGLYNEADGVRLPVVDAQGAPVEDQVLLTNVMIDLQR